MLSLFLDEDPPAGYFFGIAWTLGWIAWECGALEGAVGGTALYFFGEEGGTA